MNKRRRGTHTSCAIAGFSTQLNPHLSAHISQQKEGMQLYNHTPETHLGFAFSSSAVVILLYPTICTATSCKPSLTYPWASQLASPLFLAPSLPLNATSCSSATSQAARFSYPVSFVVLWPLSLPSVTTSWVAVWRIRPIPAKSGLAVHMPYVAAMVVTTPSVPARFPRHLSN